MLIEIEKLNIVNEGYKRSFALEKFYVNTNNIVSITDYNKLKGFLLTEAPSEISDKSFAILKVSEGNKIQEVIALGTAKEIHGSINFTGKELLNG